MSFQVTNNGPSALSGGVSVPFDASFSIVLGETLNLGPGQSQNVTIRFTPTQAGTEMASASVNSNCGSALVTLSGTGTVVPPQLAASPSQLDYGTIQRGGSQTRDITVTNTGGGTLEGQVVLNLDEGIPIEQGSFSLGPGAFQVFSVRIDVPANDPGGPFTGTVDVTSNGGEVRIPVSGTVQ